MNGGWRGGGRRILSICAGWLILAFAAPAGAVTPEQAQTLPVGELARLVLGEAGALAIDVDRPKWPVCEMMCPTPALTAEQLKQPPPLSAGLTFYLSPFAASAMTDQWQGLCGVPMVGVSFDEQGQVTGIGAGQRWGVPHGMARTGADRRMTDFGSRLAAATAECRNGADVRSFFSADNDTSALRAVIAAHLLGEAARDPARRTFKLVCQSYMSRCEGAQGVEEVAAAIAPARIIQVYQVDCAHPNAMTLSLGPGGCYHLSLASPGEWAVVEVADAYSTLRLERVEYHLNHVVY